MKSKKLMFVLSMLSLLGLVVGINDELNSRYGGGLEEAIQTWFFWSVPLIVQLIYIAIFRDNS
jgi:hypothetical protein